MYPSLDTSIMMTFAVGLAIAGTALAKAIEYGIRVMLGKEG